MKYIDADRLREELQKPKTELKVGNYYLDNSEQAVGYENALIDFELLLDSLQQEQPGLPGIEENGVPGKDFIPVEWVDACEMYGKWKIVKVEQPEVDLENYITNKLRELGADLINHKPYSFNRGLNVGKTKAYEDILGRLNTRKEE